MIVVVHTSSSKAVSILFRGPNGNIDKNQIQFKILMYVDTLR